MDEKANGKYVSDSRKFTVSKNATKLVGATSTEGAAEDTMTCNKLLINFSLRVKRFTVKL